MLLRQALIALVADMPYDAITITDITRRARVARKTFYAHFADKDALLIACIEPLLITLAESISNTDPETLLADNKPLSYPVFKHVQEHAVFYRAMLNEHGSARFILYLLDFMTHNSYERHEAIRQIAPRITVEPMLIAHFLAGALLNSIIWWLKQDCQPSADTMAYTFSQLAAPGTLAALGLE
ncbi:MAG: TetR/AcrR family transcriptional regulator [Anaerolineae bacterium]|nr:TetR/AcrR family transcriptional regulator [Anaerolineae bacterium]